MSQQIEIYSSADGQAQLRVALDKDTVWLTQAQMAELFGKDVRTVNEHIGNLFSEQELDRAATIRKFRILRKEGNREVNRDVVSLLSQTLANQSLVNRTKRTDDPLGRTFYFVEHSGLSH